MPSAKETHGQRCLIISRLSRCDPIALAGDRELEAQLEEARRKFLNRPAEAYRDDERGKALLADGIRALGNTARELARADATTIVESFGAMGRRRFSLAA